MIYEKIEKKERLIIITSFQKAKFLKELKLFDSIYFTYCIIFDNDKIDQNENWIYLCYYKIIFINENDWIKLEKSLKSILKTEFSNGFMENIKIKAGYHFNTKDSCINFMFYLGIFELFDKKEFSINQTKQDFISYCKEYKSHFDYYNTDHLKMIEQETLDDKFIGDNLIEWYTKESYFYYLLNNTLRKNNLINIFRMRYIIHEMKNALLKFNITEKDRPEMLYRASLIHEDELILLNEPNVGDNKIIQFSGFNSCTTTIDNINYIAKQNFGSKNQNLKSIVYRINIDDKHDNQMFNIKEVSYVKIEDEILLNYDSYIKINSIEESQDKYIDYYINCSFSDFDEIKSTIDPITIKMKKELNLVNNIFKNDNLYLIEILLSFSKYQECEILLENIECSEESDTFWKSYFHGTLFMIQGKYLEALEYFKISEYFIDYINENTFKVGFPKLINFYYGAIYLLLGNFSEGFKYILKSLIDTEEFRNFLNDDEIYIDPTNKISEGTFLNETLMYLDNCFYDENINKLHNINLAKFQEKIQTIFKGNFQNSIPTNVLNLNCKNKITLSSTESGSLVINHSEKSRGILDFEKSLDILENSYSNSHLTLSTAAQLSQSYFGQGLYSEAIKVSKKYLDMHIKNQGKEDFDFGFLNLIIGKAYFELKEYISALEYLQVSKKIFENLQSYFSLLDTCYFIGRLYENIENYQEALKYLGIIENYFIENPQIDMFKFFLIRCMYVVVINIYRKLKNDFKELEYEQKLLSINERMLGDSNEDVSQNHENISILLYNIGLDLFEKEEFKQALEYFERSLFHKEKCGSSDLETFEKLYQYIINIQKILNEELVIDYFNQKLKTKEKIYGIDDTVIAITRYYIAKIYEDKGNFLQAFENYMISLDILKENIEHDDPDIIKIQEKIIQISSFL